MSRQATVDESLKPQAASDVTPEEARARQAASLKPQATMTEDGPRADVCILYGVGRQDEAADLAARLSHADVSWIMPQADREAANEVLVGRYLATDVESPAAPALWNRLQTYKQTCLLAVRRARCLMLLEPGGANGWYLAGVAQAAGKPVCRYADLTGTAPTPMLFDTARAWSLEQAVEWVGRMLAATPLVSVGQGSGERHWPPADPRYQPYAR